MKKRQAPRETDLYPPLRDYLIAQGYAVRAEVKGCDVAATKGNDLVIIELKQAFSLTLLAQAADRQRVSDSVYVALPRPRESLWSKRWKAARHLLRRLEIGLILIAPRSRTQAVEIIFHPIPFAKRKRSVARRAVLQEMSGRSGDYNLGGSTRRPLVTAYRETAIRIACWLDQLGPTSPRQLRALGTGPRTTGILYDNVYGWFVREGRGIYGLTEQGRAALTKYSELVSAVRTEQLPAAVGT